MAKKLDLSKAKEFLFNHGEKVALGAFAFIALLLGLMGLMRGFGAGTADGSSKSWAEELKYQTSQVNQRMASAQAEPLDKDLQSVLDNPGKWDEFKMRHPNPAPFIAVPDVGGDRRYNPNVYPIDPKLIDMKYVAGCVMTYKYDDRYLKTLKPGDGAAAGGGGGGVPPSQPPGPTPPGPMGNKGGKLPPGAGNNAPEQLNPPMLAAVPRRMIVVTAVFPMKQQVMEFQRAFKMATQEELFTTKRDDLPKPVGLNIVRYECKPDGTPINNEGEVVISWDHRNRKLHIARTLDEVLTSSKYDDKTPEALASYLWDGLCMPMPLVKNVPYPRFTFDGFDITWGDEEVDMKEKPGGGEPGPMPPPKGGLPGPKGGLPGPKGSGAGKLPPSMPPGGKAPPSMPPGGVGGANDAGADGPADGTPENTPAKKVEANDPDLFKRLFPKKGVEKYNPFHVLGLFAPKVLPNDPKAGGGAPGIAPPGMGVGAGMGIGGAQNDGRYFHAWDIDPPVGGGAGGAGGVPSLPPGPMPPGPMGSGSKGNKNKPGANDPAGNAAEPFPNWSRDALVRFIDPDVHPGKTYRYAVQVRMANPNFKRGAEVAWAHLATIEELNSKWEYTPPFTCPQEYRLYAVDQKDLDDIANLKAAPKTFDLKASREQVAFQIHQWVSKRRNFESPRLEMDVIGDWAVAERVAVRRGERIGDQVVVKAPIWREVKTAFVMPTYNINKGTKLKEKLADGIRIDMKPETLVEKKTTQGGVTTSKWLPTEEDLPVLVDFHGGKRGKAGTNTLDEDSAVEALVLTADGKLRVLNSRADSDPQEDGKDERKDRVARARHRAEDANPAVGAGSSTPPGPKGGLPGPNSGSK